MSQPKVTAIMRAAAVALADGKTPRCTYVTMDRLVEAGLATWTGGNGTDAFGVTAYSLTESGKALATVERVKAEKARSERNGIARQRNAWMRSLGFVRTPTGAWE